MSHPAIQLDQRVITALDVYDPPRRDEVMAEIFRLIENPANRHKVDDLPPDERIYLADTPAGLRVVFRTDEDGRVVELVDFFRPWWARGVGSDEPCPATAP